MPAAHRPLSRPRKGFNLIEAAIVLGVVGLVIGGIWTAASAVYENLRINEAIRGFIETEANTQNLISINNSTSMGHRNITNLVAPSNWINPLGGFEVRSGPGQFSILTSVPRWACERLIIKVGEWGLKNEGNIPYNLGRGRMWRLQGYDSAGNNLWNNHGSGFPVSLETAKTFCDDTRMTGMFIHFNYIRRN